MFNLEKSKLYTDSIILIGPSGAGKSTVAEELRKITYMPRLCLDRIANADRRNGVMRNFNSPDEYNLSLLQKVLDAAVKEGAPGIVDFGAGHSVYRSKEIFEKVKKLLSNFDNVVLLLPSENIEESIDIMAKRSTGDYSTNREFILSPCNKELATMTVYGNNRTPEEIAKDILDRIKDRKTKNNDEKDEEEIH